ncbi:hypothetical protein CARUB_v10012015mg, partial [Capsella rubella]
MTPTPPNSICSRHVAVIGAGAARLIAVPDPFKDQVVIVIGNQSSGRDVSKDIATLAKEVHIATKFDAYDKKTVFADAIVHCTDYKYRFPFLETNDYLTIEDNRVGPLYKHVFPPALAPGLSFIGLPSMVGTNKWVASVLSGRVQLPSEDEMIEDRFTHFLTDPQFSPMFEKLKPHEACGCSSIDPWREEQYNIAIKKDDDSYRDDVWDEHDQLLQKAYRDFAKIQTDQC